MENRILWWSRRLWRSVILVIVLMMTPGVLSADSPAEWAGDTGMVVQEPLGPSDPAEVEAFLDTVITEELRRHQIPGASVAVVKNGALLFAKGYGDANARDQQSVVAERTLFHIGSITKLFTWTAVMQLVERGELDLHTDLNQYLPDAAQLPDTYPEPVTMHHLLTHTPGFADSLNHLYRISAYDGIPLDRYVVERMPDRILPPGELIGYSNYAAGLAGYVIEQVTAMPYEDYIEQHILEPLEMTHSSIRQPVPEGWQEDLALGHVQVLGRMVPIQEFFPSSPVVGMIATSTDMANFMIAHLQEGRFKEVRILQAATALQMQRQQFSHEPRVTGVTYGFVEWRRNGQQVLWHEGSTALFQGLIILLPDDDVGVFISYNYKGNNGARREFRQAFLDHYYPTELSDAEPLPDYRARAPRFAGTYRESRWAHHTSDKLFYLFARTHRVIANPEGTITLLDKTYAEVAPLFFRELTGPATLAFREDAKGRITHAFYDTDPHEALIRIPWYETPVTHIGLFAVFFLVFLYAMLTPSPVIPGRSSSLLISEGRHIFQWLGGVSLFYPFGMFVVWLTVQIWALPSLAFFAPLFVLALILPLVGAIIVITTAWALHIWDLKTRIVYSLVTLTTLMYLIWLDYWNLLGLWHL